MIRQQRQAGGSNASHSAASATGTSHTSADRSNPQNPAVRKKLSIAELKLVSRCANCGQKGHWKAECTNAYRPKQVHMTEEGHTAFVYGPNSGGNEHPDSGFLWWSNMAKQTAQNRAQEWLARRCPGLSSRPECMAPHIFLTLPAGTAIVDSAAGQDLIGKPTYDRLCEIWAQHNIKPLRLEKRPQAAAGVGGKAHPLFQALIPLAFPGADIGFVEVTVVDADLPHLLSVGLLTHLGAVINLEENTLELRAMNKVFPMTRTPEGHCYVDVANWSGSEPIVMSAQAAQGYGVSPDALQMKVVHHATSESRTSQVRVKAASAVHRAYSAWRSSSSAAVSVQTRQSHHVGQRRKESTDSSHPMEASRARRSVARTYLLLAAASIGLHWQTDGSWGKSQCHREPLCTSPPEEGCKPAWHLDDMPRLQNPADIFIQGQGRESQQHPSTHPTAATGSSSISSGSSEAAITHESIEVTGEQISTLQRRLQRQQQEMMQNMRAELVGEVRLTAATIQQQQQQQRQAAQHQVNPVLTDSDSDMEIVEPVQHT
eukprot:5762779-Amphidinium_carterae.1